MSKRRYPTRDQEANHFNARYNQAVSLVGYAWDQLGDVRLSGAELEKINEVYQMLDKAIGLLIDLSPDKLRPRTRARLIARHEEVA